MSEVATNGRLLADRYRLGEVLGKGGMGTVWRAVDETLGRSVAVKELRFPGNVDEDEKRRLVTRTLREAKATARIRNSGAITVFDVVKEDDRPWIVMELVEGRSLSDAIREDGPLTPQRAAEVGLVLLDVLKAAHAEGILHRDVKPSNVLIAHGDPAEGGGHGRGRVVLGDFGIAKIDGDPSVTSTGMLVGAPSYISPERARGHKPGPPADLWSLGALLYAAVEGHPPYDKGSAIATLTAVMTEPVGPMRNAGPLAEVISGLLVKDPARRLDNAGARRLLTEVANAPAQPDAAGGQGESATRTVPLPVDPQPVPTDAPPAVRAAAADQERMRSALRSVRRAAAAPPASRATEPTGAHPAPPHRGLAVVIAVLVLALLGTVVGIALAHGGGKGGGDSKKHGHGKNSASAATPTSHDSADGSTGAAAPPAAAPAAPTTAPVGADGGLPAGWHIVHDPEGFSIALPKGWKRVGDNGHGVGSHYKGPGVANLLVDWTHQPGKSALGAWQKAEAVVIEDGTMPGYHRFQLAEVDYRSYDAADWEYRRLQAGKPVHVLNRGMVTDSSHGYALMYTTPAGEWNSAANRLARTTFFKSFKPAK